MTWVWVFVGGGLGSALRYGVGLLIPATPFNWAVLAVNVLGSGVAGYFVAMPNLSESLRLGLAVGLLGGFTTFSAFSVETVRLYSEHQIFLVFMYILANVVLSLGACYIAFRLCAV